MLICLQIDSNCNWSGGPQQHRGIYDSPDKEWNEKHAGVTQADDRVLYPRHLIIFAEWCHRLDMKAFHGKVSGPFMQCIIVLNTHTHTQKNGLGLIASKDLLTRPP